MKGSAVLIKRTGWLEFGQYDYINFINKAQTFWVCADGLRKVFKLPQNVGKVRFYVYDKPTKMSTRVKIVQEPLIGYWEVAVGSARLGIDYHFMSQDALQKLFIRQEYYYAECEYECFTKHEWEVLQLSIEIENLKDQNEDLKRVITGLRNC